MEEDIKFWRKCTPNQKLVAMWQLLIDWCCLKRFDPDKALHINRNSRIRGIRRYDHA